MAGRSTKDDLHNGFKGENYPDKMESYELVATTCYGRKESESIPYKLLARDLKIVKDVLNCHNNTVASTFGQPRLLWWLFRDNLPLRRGK